MNLRSRADLLELSAPLTVFLKMVSTKRTRLTPRGEFYVYRFYLFCSCLCFWFHPCF